MIETTDMESKGCALNVFPECLCPITVKSAVLHGADLREESNHTWPTGPDILQESPICPSPCPHPCKSLPSSP